MADANVTEVGQAATEVALQGDPGLIKNSDGETVIAVTADEKVGIGTTTPATVLDVVGGITATSGNDGAGTIAVRSGDATQYSKISLGTNANKATVGVSGAADTFFTGVAQDDLVIRADDNNSKVHIGAGTSGGAQLVVTEHAGSAPRVGVGTASPGTSLQIEDGDPYITLKNSTPENGAGGCDSKLIFEDHADNALGQIEVSHVGSSDDEKGQLIIKTNNDSGLQTAVTIDEAQQVIIPDGKLVLASTAITATGTELNYVGGVSSAIQTQLDGKSPTAGHSSIATVGTIGTGTWQGTVVASAYLDAQTAHLDTTQTFSGAKTFSAASIHAGVSLSEAKSLSISTPALATTNQTATGVTAVMLAGAAIVAFEAVCISTTSGKIVKADASVTGTMPVIGIATEAFSGDDETGTVLLHGFIRDDAWNWGTIGGVIYASETGGDLTQTAPTTSGAFVQALGVALTADVVYFNPSLTLVTVA